MKGYFHAFVMCQSMFCAIPFPTKIWDKDARPLMLLFLPVVGLEIGLIWAGVAWLAEYLHLPQLVIGLALSAYSFLVTGFLHLDGFRHGRFCLQRIQGAGYEYGKPAQRQFPVCR